VGWKRPKEGGYTRVSQQIKYIAAKYVSYGTMERKFSMMIAFGDRFDEVAKSTYKA